MAITSNCAEIIITNPQGSVSFNKLITTTELSPAKTIYSEDRVYLIQDSENMPQTFWWNLEKAIADGYADLEELYDYFVAEIANQCGGGGGSSYIAPFLKTGGASWSGTGLVYDVTTLEYYFNGDKLAAATQVILAVADPTNNRLDAIVVDESGVIKYIENTSTSSALGGLNAIDFADTSTRVLVRYKVTSTKGEDSLVRLSLKIGNLNRFNVVKHSYNGELKPTSDPKVIASTNPEHNGFGFLQGFGGLRTRLKFDDKTIKAFAGKGYKIHRAELVVEPYFPGGLLNYKNMPMSLSAYYPKTEKGKEIMLFTPDMEIFKEVSTNAFYNRSQRLYSLNITTFFKDAMRGVKPNEFYLYAGVPAGLYSSQSSSYGTNYAELPSDFLSLPNQVILKGQMKLIITYSK